MGEIKRTLSISVQVQPYHEIRPLCLSLLRSRALFQIKSNSHFFDIIKPKPPTMRIWYDKLVTFDNIHRSENVNFSTVGLRWKSSLCVNIYINVHLRIGCLDSSSRTNLKHTYFLSIIVIIIAIDSVIDFFVSLSLRLSLSLSDYSRFIHLTY